MPSKLNIRYWTGLTATAYRSDGLDPIAIMSIGPVLHAIASQRTARREYHPHLTEFTHEILAPIDMTEIYNALVADAIRNAQSLTVSAATTQACQIVVVLSNRCPPTGSAHVRPRVFLRVVFWFYSWVKRLRSWWRLRSSRRSATSFLEPQQVIGNDEASIAQALRSFATDHDFAREIASASEHGQTKALRMVDANLQRIESLLNGKASDD